MPAICQRHMGLYGKPHLPEDFAQSCKLGHDYYWYNFLNESTDRDTKARNRLYIANSNTYTLDISDYCEFKLDGDMKLAAGMTLAERNKGLAISFCHSIWDAHTVEITCSVDGTTRTVNHASALDHIISNRDWLLQQIQQTMGAKELKNADGWKKFFPKLSPCKNTISMLDKITGNNLRPGCQNPVLAQCILS